MSKTCVVKGLTVVQDPVAEEHALTKLFLKRMQNDKQIAEAK